MTSLRQMWGEAWGDGGRPHCSVGTPRGLRVRCFWQECHGSAGMSSVPRPRSSGQADLGPERLATGEGRLLLLTHRVAGLLGCPLRLPCGASASVGRGPRAPSCRACCGPAPLARDRQWRKERGRETSRPCFRLHRAPDGHRPLHSPAQRHPEAGALQKPHDPQCLQPGRESDPHPAVEDTPAQGEGREGGSAPPRRPAGLAERPRSVAEGGLSVLTAA